MREAVSLMGGYGITEDCPGFLGHKWMDSQLEATYERPEAVQRRNLTVTMTNEVFLAQFKNWIAEMRVISSQRPGTGACALATAMRLWRWTFDHLQIAKVHSQRRIAALECAAPGRCEEITRISGDPILELRKENFIRHRDGEVAALHGLWTFVGGFELRVHPLVSPSSGESSVIPYPPMRLTASHIGNRAFSVFQSGAENRSDRVKDHGARPLVFMELAEPSRAALGTSVRGIETQLRVDSPGGELKFCFFTAAIPFSARISDLSSPTDRERRISCGCGTKAEVASPMAHTSMRRCNTSWRCWPRS